MSLVSALAIYFVIWWTVLFAVLPWGVRTQAEQGEIVPGSVPSAPARMRFLRIIVGTSLASGVVFLGLVAILHSGLTLDDIPFVRDL